MEHDSGQPVLTNEQTDCVKIGATLYGKFARVLVYRERVEVRTLSTVFLILVLWLSALVLFFLGLFFLDLFYASLISLVGGLAAFFLAFLSKGKLEQKMEYRELTSFVCEDGEFIFNCSNNQMFSIRMSKKKQALLMKSLTEMAREYPGVKLSRMGKYLKVIKTEAPPEKSGPKAPASKS